LEEQEIRFDKIFDGLKKRWLMIVSITLITTIISAVISFFVIDPKYKASAKLFVGKYDEETEEYSQSDVLMYQNLMETYAEAIKTKDLIGRALNNTDSDLTKEVLENITVITVEDTQILEISYQSNYPQEARGILENIIDEFIRASKNLVPNGNIQILESVQTPKNPVSPNKKMNMAAAFLLGLMVGVGLAFILESLDNTFKTKEELEIELDIPVIGTIPEIKE
jgi:capsular polysaccharide biosynthesis protein